MSEYQLRKSNIKFRRIKSLPTIAGKFQKVLLDPVDVRLNGNRPWDIEIRDSRLFARVARDGSLGFAESYMDGWWDCQQMDVMFTKLLSGRIDRRPIGLAKLKMFFSIAVHILFNMQTIKRSMQVGKVHYDIGNDLYQKMLGPTMMYSCGYWKDANTLDQAQRDKMDLICRKLELEPGMTLLDVGCGWGTLALYAAENYGVKVTGITISEEQVKLINEQSHPYDVKIMLKDYREMTGTFDRIVSVGMFEHVGVKNYRIFFDAMSRLMKGDGIFLLHTIGQENGSNTPESFIHKYIFPNGRIPSRRQITNSSVDYFRMEDWHNFGPDYDRTLMAWLENFERSWPELNQQYDERFYRMWRYYLNSCAGYFRSRQGQLWQLVFTSPNNKREYRSIR